MSTGFLSRREHATVAAFADVFVEGADELLSPTEIADRVDLQLARMAGTKRTRSLRLVLWIVEYVVPVLGFRFRRFSKIGKQGRRRLVDRVIARSRLGPLRSLGKIRALFIAAYYSDERVKRRVGFVPIDERGRDTTPAGRGEVRTHTPDQDVLEVDVCVIGSGAGGAVVAARAAAHHRVALLEEGPYVTPPELDDDEQKMVALLYKEHGLQTTVDLGMTILQGKVLGGTTFVNNAICFQVGDEQLRSPAGAPVLEDWRRVGARVDAEALHTAYERVEQELGVAPIADDAVGASGNLLIDGWRAIGGNGRHGVFRKNLTAGCIACGYCNFGCPFEHKLSTLETYVKAAADAGGHVIPDCHVKRLERKGDRVTGVRAQLADGRELTVRAKVVVLAAGAIGSSVLLMKSGFRRNVGTRFSFNAASPVIARFDRSLRSWDADQMTAFVDCGPFLLESSFDPPMSLAVSVPGWFGAHFERMGAYDRLTRLGVVVGTEPNGRVKRTGLLRDWLGPVAWTMTDHDLATLKDGIATAARLYLKAGAREVYPPTFADRPLTAEEFAPDGEPDAERIACAIDDLVRKPGDVLLNSSHPQGGNPMSDDRKVGVVGSDFRVHGTENLFVCDASVFPSSVHINPQLTVMAMADYAWTAAIREAA